MRTFFLGDVKITDSKAYLNNCIESYSRALHDFVGIHLIIKVWELVKGTCSSLDVSLIVNRDRCIKSPKSKRRTEQYREQIFGSLSS